MNSRKFSVTLLVTILTIGCVALLAACGDNAATTTPEANPAAAPTSTPIPTFTPAPATSPPGPNAQMVQVKPISGTVESYDPSSKLLIIKGADGKDQRFMLNNTRVMKSEKVTADQFGKLLTTDNDVAVTGDKGSDGVYTARALMLLGENKILVGGPPPNGTPGPGSGTDSSKSETPGLVLITHGPDGSPPPGTPIPGGYFQVGGPATAGGDSSNLPLIPRSAKLENNQLTGSNPVTNETVTVKLTGDTKLSNQTVGKPEDLKVGQTVNVTAPPTQANTPGEALVVSIE